MKAVRYPAEKANLAVSQECMNEGARVNVSKNIGQINIRSTSSSETWSLRRS